MTAPLPTTATAHRFAEAAAILELSADYKVLRRFTPDPGVYLGSSFAPPPECKTGIFLDVETEGLDVGADQVIELALVPFTFDPDGVIYDAGKGVSMLQDPKRPLPARIVELTGITDEMVRGQKINAGQVEAIIADAAIIIAHHADFDRKMVERPFPVFRDRAWGCSYREVPWEETFGCRVSKLPIILSDACGQFTEANHRALEDCHIGVSVLANARAGGRTALSYLLESARLPTFRIWAKGSPFQAKDKLRERGYFWEGNLKKCWYRDVREADVDEEMMFARDVGGAQPVVEKYTAKTRYR